MLLKEEIFSDLIKQWWNTYQCLGTPCYVLAYKRLKLDLKCWNKKVFGSVEAKKKSPPCWSFQVLLHGLFQHFFFFFNK